MANKKNTIFQNLGNALFYGFDKNIESQQKTIHSYTINSDKTIYKAKDSEDFEKTKLQLRQEKYLANQWVSAAINLNQTTSLVSNNLKLMYRDADIMDGYPLIGAALDLISEECCTFNTKGQILNITSNSDRIKKVLDDLFINRLDIHINLPMWTRSMCKYGNSFVLLNIDKNGIIGSRQLPVYEIERVENGIYNPYLAVPSDHNKNKDTEFVWIGQSMGTPFKNWQVAHFRLLTDSLFLPYGCLEGTTRIETEYGYKEIEQIEPGDKVWTFDVEKQIKVLGQVTHSVYKGIQQTYNIKTKHNYIVGTDDHKLLTYDNNNLMYKEIKDLKIGDLIVIDNSRTKLSKPTYIDKSPLVSTEANLKKSTQWWTNNLKYMPDIVDVEFAKFFGFMIGDGWISNNRDVYFATGEYHMFNKEFAEYLHKITNNDIRFIKPYNKANGDYEFSQVVCSSKMLAIILRRMGFVGKFDDKRIPKWVFESSNEIKKAFLDGLMIADGSFNIDKYGCLRCQIELSNQELIKDIKILVQSLGYKSGHIGSRNRKTISILKDGRKIKAKHTSYYIYYFESFNKQEKKYDLSNRLSENFKTEKIISITKDREQKVYDITIDNDNANFYANGIITHNCSFLHKARRHFRILSMMEDMMLIYRLERSIERRVFKIFVGNIDDADIPAYVQEIANTFKRTPIIDPETGQLDLRKSSLDATQDIFIPVKDANASSPIETLPAASNLEKIEDLKYIQNQLLTALRIPKEFLNFEEASGDGKNLALKDIRFTRTVNRIQQALIMELTKIATIHLYLNGFTDELTNFKITMNSPSTQSEMLKLEELSKKIGLATAALSDPGNGIQIMSLTRAQREILGWSDAEITQNMLEIRFEKALAAELAKTEQIIKRTGVFNNVDKIYGEPDAEYSESAMAEDGSSGGGGAGGLGGGFGDDLGGDSNLNEPNLGDEEIEAGEPTPNNTQVPNNEPKEQSSESPEGLSNTKMEKIQKKVDKLLLEKQNLQIQNSKMRRDKYLNAYIQHIQKNNINENKCDNIEIINQAFIKNEETNSLVKMLDQKLR